MSDSKKILLVEDDNAISKILVNKLNSVGYTTLHADNGQDGLKIALEQKPDLILLDIMMPIMDGIAMLKELRKDAWGQNASVIIMTNLTNDDKLDEAFKNGVYEYLVKANWELDDVIAKIKTHFENS